MDFTFEYLDYSITIEIEPGDDMDDPCDWSIAHIEYVDSEPLNLEGLSSQELAEIEKKCEYWASSKAYDAWLDRACSRADSLVDYLKEN